MRKHLILAFGYLEAGLDAAAADALAAAFADPDALGPALELAAAAWRDGGPDAGRAAFRTVAEAAALPAAWAAWARHARTAVGPAEAETVLAEARERFPDDADLINQHAALLLSQHRCAAALGLLDRLDAAAALHPYVLCNRGHALLGLGRPAEAEVCFDAALAVAPEMFEAVYGRAVAALDRRDDAAAEAGLRAALALRPDSNEARFRLAEVLARRLRFDDARAVLAEVLADDPGNFTALYQTGVLHFLCDRYVEAIDWGRRALAVDPQRHEVYDLLGLALVGCGRAAEAAPCFADAARLTVPQAPAYASNRAFILHYDPARTAEEIFAAHRAWGERFGGAGDDPARRFANPPDPERRLRIGYVSPDFRAHSVAYFTIPLISAHDRERFEVFAYSATDKPDRVTEWIAERVDGWREVLGKSDAAVREVIAADRIDILVDLAGHTASNLLPVFARRAAPVQATYIGYPDTTGVPAIDYRIVDAVTDPPGAEVWATERLVRLDRPFLAYRPVPDRPPVSAGPAATGAPFTFGSFNTALKLNDRVFDAWAEILRGVPGARLLLKAKQFAERAACDWVREAFAARGVDPQRVDTFAFMPTLGSHLEIYDRVDLALDTFPYNGTTTTCEAFSMGVPVLAVKGERHMSRVAESLLGAIGVDPVFLADDVADYVRRAIGWAARRGALAAMRPEIHRRLVSSMLCDERGLTRDVEAAYRRMWREWCAAGPRCGLGPSRFEREMAACART